MSQRIAAIESLQQRFADPRFAFVSDKVKTHFAAAEKQAAALQSSKRVPPQVVEHLRSLTIGLSQAERLHVIIYEELTAARERQPGKGFVTLVVFIFAVFTIGYLCVRKGLRAIGRITAHQRETEQTLRLAISAAESASAAKSEFLASMSHELRTPLNSILGYSQVLRMPSFAPAQEKRIAYAKNILVAGEHLLALIENILDLSKIEAGGDVLSETELDLAAVFEDACRIVGGLADKKSVSVRYECPAGLGLIADRQRLTQIVVNLLSNAIKFNRAGGHVVLTASAEPGEALSISVTDSGIGIPSSELSKVFEPFTQVRSSALLAHEGTGLGLPLSRKLAELHDGRIDLRSEVGVGTTATVAFPPERVVRFVGAECAPAVREYGRESAM